MPVVHLPTTLDPSRGKQVVNLAKRLPSAFKQAATLSNLLELLQSDVRDSLQLAASFSAPFRLICFVTAVSWRDGLAEAIRCGVGPVGCLAHHLRPPAHI